VREREREKERESLKNVKEERKLTNVQCLMKKSIVLGVNEFQLTRGVSYRYFLLLFWQNKKRSGLEFFFHNLILFLYQLKYILS
jgi:hypothetical protein